MEGTEIPTNEITRGTKLVGNYALLNAVEELSLLLHESFNLWLTMLPSPASVFQVSIDAFPKGNRLILCFWFSSSEFLSHP